MAKFLMLLLVPLAACCQCLAADSLDLSKVTVVVPVEMNRQELRATQMLVDEIAIRTQIRPLITNTAPADAPLIVLENLRTGPAEGYRIWAEGLKVRIS